MYYFSIMYLIQCDWNNHAFKTCKDAWIKYHRIQIYEKTKQNKKQSPPLGVPRNPAVVQNDISIRSGA